MQNSPFKIPPNTLFSSDFFHSSFSGGDFFRGDFFQGDFFLKPFKLLLVILRIEGDHQREIKDLQNI